MSIVGAKVGDLPSIVVVDAVGKKVEVVAKARVKAAALDITGVDEELDAVAAGDVRIGDLLDGLPYFNGGGDAVAVPADGDLGEGALVAEGAGDGQQILLPFWAVERWQGMGGNLRGSVNHLKAVNWRESDEPFVIMMMHLPPHHRFRC